MRTKVSEIDIAKGIVAVRTDPAYEHYRTLVRVNRQPLCWINYSRENRDLIREEMIAGLIASTADPLVLHTLMHQPSKAINKNYAISVIVCTRNRTASLQNCLKQLLKLRYEKFEIIVVDNAPSNNETRKLTEVLPVRYVLEPRQGLNHARNRGIAESKYEIVAFTDDDTIVDENWLHAINDIFQDEKLQGASGWVGPAELETPAQHLFENGYGGMGHGFIRKYFQKERLSPEQLLWASGFGIGANMAFRKQVFHSTGNFDPAFDVGTPTNGGGDIEMFHRLVAKGNLFAYDPSMIVWHYHRRDDAALKKQVYDNGKSFGCYLINCYQQKTASGSVIAKFFVKEWLVKWILKNILRRRFVIPYEYSLAELNGMMSSPFALKNSRKVNNSGSEN